MSLGGTGVGGLRARAPEALCCSWWREVRYLGVFQAVHGRMEDSMWLLKPIIHWLAKFPEVGAAWCILSQWGCSSWVGASQVMVK